jgi:hypothetical protein
MTRLGRQAMTCGPVPARSWEASSAKVTSRTQCRPFSIVQCPRRRSASRAGLAWAWMRLVIDVALGEHRAAGVVHRGQQVDLPAVAAGAPQRLAVDRDRPSPLGWVVAVGEPGADHGGQRRWVHTAPGSGGWWPRPALPSGRGRHGERRARPAPAAGCPRPTRRSRSLIGRRPGPRRRPWPGSRPAGAGGRRPVAGRGSWRGRRAGAVVQLVGGDRSRKAEPGPTGSKMMGRQARASTVVMRL